MGDPIHEAICAAAGWPAYCSECGAKMARANHGLSYCSDKTCSSHDAIPPQPYWSTECGDFP